MDLERTVRGRRVRLDQTKGRYTDAVTIPLPYDDTELCPVRVLDCWIAATGITEGHGGVCRQDSDWTLSPDESTYVSKSAYRLLWARLACLRKQVLTGARL